MLNRRRLIPLASLCLLLGAFGLQARTWISADGRSLEADFISATEKDVTVRRLSDLRIFTIPLSELSAVDREFVLERLESEDREESAPFETAAEPPVNRRMLASEITANMGGSSYPEFEDNLDGMDGIVAHPSNLLSRPDGTQALRYTGRWLQRDAERLAIRSVSAIFATPEELVGRKGHLIAGRASATLVGDHPFITSTAPLYVNDAAVFEGVEWIQLVRSDDGSPDYETTELMELRRVNPVTGQLTINRIAPDASRAEWKAGDLAFAIPDFDPDSGGVKFLLQPDSPAALEFAAERLRTEARGGDGKRLWDFLILNAVAERHVLLLASREGVRVDLNRDGRVESPGELLSSGTALVETIGRHLAPQAGGPGILVHLNNLPASEFKDGKADGVFLGWPFVAARRQHWDFSSWLNTLAYSEGGDALGVIEPWDALSAGLGAFFADVTVTSHRALHRYPVLYDANDAEFAWLGEPQGPAGFLAEASEGSMEALVFDKEDFNALPPAEIKDATPEGFTLMPRETGAGRMRWRMDSIPGDSVLFLDVESASEGVLSLSPVYRSRPFHAVPYAQGFRRDGEVEMLYPHDAGFDVEAAISPQEDLLNGYTWTVEPGDDSAFIEVLVRIPDDAAHLAFAWSAARATEGRLSVLSAEDGERKKMLRFDLTRNSKGKAPLIADLGSWAGQNVRLRFEVRSLGEPYPLLTRLTRLAFADEPAGAKEPGRKLRIRTLESPVGPSIDRIGFYVRDFSEESLELELSWDGEAPLRVKHPRLGENQPLVVREFTRGLCLINPSLTNRRLDLSEWFPDRKFAHHSGPSAGSRVREPVKIPALGSIAFRYD